MLTVRSFIIALALFITGCVPVYRQHGYVPPETDLASVIVGKTSRSELESIIGQPSSQGLLEGSAWYYVGSRWRYYGPLRPREVSREVVAIHFSPNNTVSNIERFGLEQGRVVTLSRRVTDSNVTSVNLIRQLLGNVGNYNPAGVLGQDG